MNTSINMFICDNYIFINIFDISVNFFFICQDGYFHKNAFYIKFFNKFSLPDVPSAVIAVLHIISLVVSVVVVVVVVVVVTEDDEPNKV